MRVVYHNRRPFEANRAASKWTLHLASGAGVYTLCGRVIEANDIDDASGSERPQGAIHTCLVCASRTFTRTTPCRCALCVSGTMCAGEAIRQVIENRAIEDKGGAK